MARIAFIQNLYLESNAATLLSAILKAEGHTTEAFIESRGLFSALARFQPDLVCFSVSTGLHLKGLNIAFELKSRFPVTVVFGGPHPTFFPEVIEHEAVDIICRGEGELAMATLAAAIDRAGAENRFKSGLASVDLSSVPNIWYKKDGQVLKNDLAPLIEDLDTLPFPDRNLFYSKYPLLNLGRKEFMTSRGCPYRCTFCFNHAYNELYRGKGSMLRRRSPENVIKEITEVRARFGLKHVSFPDDTFNLDREWFLHFLDLYASRVHLPFSCNIRADLADRETVAALKKAGCASANFGIESGNDEIRLKVLKKALPRERIIETAALLKEYGIGFKTFNILGLPGETLDNAFETIELNAAIGSKHYWCSLYQPYPGTELGREALQKFACADIDSPSFFDRSGIRQEHSGELDNLHKLFSLGVMFPQAKGLLRQLIKLPPNPLYKIIFYLVYSLQAIRTEGFTKGEFFRLGLMNAKRFLTRAKD